MEEVKRLSTTAERWKSTSGLIRAMLQLVRSRVRKSINLLVCVLRNRFVQIHFTENRLQPARSPNRTLLSLWEC